MKHNKCLYPEHAPFITTSNMFFDCYSVFLFCSNSSNYFKISYRQEYYFFYAYIRTYTTLYLYRSSPSLISGSYNSTIFTFISRTSAFLIVYLTCSILISVFSDFLIVLLVLSNFLSSLLSSFSFILILDYLATFYSLVR